MTGADGRDWTEGETMPFSEDDVLLPWLDSDEPLEEHRASGPRRLWLLIAAGAILAAVAGGIYWLAGKDGAPPKGDVPLIETPERPRSVGPANEARTATPAASRTPLTAVVEPANEAPIMIRPDAARTSSEIGPEVAAPQLDGFIVQVGAYGSRRRAKIGWEFLTGSQQVLQGVPHRVVRAVVDGKTVYRLQAVVQSPSAAGKLCAALQANGAECLVRN
jgi:cell division protein FtsN